MSKKVAIQGYAASFHDVAARQLISQDIIIVPCETFADVFACVADGRADVGVVAIANSNFGSISESQSLVASQPIAVTGTLDLRIEQCLLGLPGARSNNAPRSCRQNPNFGGQTPEPKP